MTRKEHLEAALSHVVYVLGNKKLDDKITNDLLHVRKHLIILKCEADKEK